jgi:hypothetical protein
MKCRPEEMRLLPDEQQYCWQEVGRLKADSHKQAEDAIKGLKLKLGQIDDRLNRLTDAYIVVGHQKT